MRNWVWRSLTLPLVLLLAWPAGADSYIDECGSGSVTFINDVTVGYDGVGSGAGDSDVVNLIGFVSAPIPVGEAKAFVEITPATGDPKDFVEGTLSSRFSYGTPVGLFPLDLLEFEIDGNASALNAINFANSQADAFVFARGQILFSLPTSGPGGCDGLIQLGALRNLQPFEDFIEITVFEDTDLIATLTPGSPGRAVSIQEGHGYGLQILYSYVVPYGIDPAYSFSYSATLSSTVAASTLGTRGAVALGLLMLGAALLAVRVGRATPA